MGRHRAALCPSLGSSELVTTSACSSLLSHSSSGPTHLCLAWQEGMAAIRTLSLLECYSPNVSHAGATGAPLQPCFRLLSPLMQMADQQNFIPRILVASNPYIPFKFRVSSGRRMSRVETCVSSGCGAYRASSHTRHAHAGRGHAAFLGERV